MSAYVQVPRDLSRVKSKVLFNLTKRQLVCFTVAALIGVPLFFLVRYFGSTSAAVLCMMTVMLPFFFLGMYERDGQTPEEIAKQFIQAKFVRPEVRPYKTDNYYAILIRQAKAEEEVKSIVFGKRAVSEKRKNKRKSAGELKQGRGKADKTDHRAGEK